MFFRIHRLKYNIDSDTNAQFFLPNPKRHLLGSFAHKIHAKFACKRVITFAVEHVCSVCMSHAECSVWSLDPMRLYIYNSTPIKLTKFIAFDRVAVPN